MNEVCEDCGALLPADMGKRAEPLALELDDVEILLYMCDECYNERGDSV